MNVTGTNCDTFFYWIPNEQCNVTSFWSWLVDRSRRPRKNNLNSKSIQPPRACNQPAYRVLKAMDYYSSSRNDHRKYCNLLPSLWFLAFSVLTPRYYTSPNTFEPHTSWMPSMDEMPQKRWRICSRDICTYVKHSMPVLPSFLFVTRGEGATLFGRPESGFIRHPHLS